MWGTKVKWYLSSRAAVLLTVNQELCVCRDGFLCIVSGVAAVGSHVVTGRQDQAEDTSYGHVRGRLRLYVKHLLVILKRESLISACTSVRRRSSQTKCLTLNQVSVAAGFPPVEWHTRVTLAPERRGVSSGGESSHTFWGGSVVNKMNTFVSNTRNYTLKKFVLKANFKKIVQFFLKWGLMERLHTIIILPAVDNSLTG